MIYEWKLVIMLNISKSIKKEVWKPNGKKIFGATTHNKKCSEGPHNKWQCYIAKLLEDQQNKLDGHITGRK